MADFRWTGDLGEGKKVGRFWEGEKGGTRGRRSGSPTADGTLTDGGLMGSREATCAFG